MTFTKRLVLALLTFTLATAATAQDVYFQLVEIKPMENYSFWSLQGNTIQYYASNVGAAGYAWSAVPQRLEMGQQMYVQIAVRAQSNRGSRLYTGISMKGFGVPGNEQGADVNSEDGFTAENRMNVLLTAPSYGSPGDKHYLMVGAYYGIGVTYVYQAFAR